MTFCTLEPLDINSNARDIEDYFERFEIWWLTRPKVDEEKKSIYFLNAAGKSAYTLIENLVYPESPVAVSYEKLKELLLQHLKPVYFEAAERAKFHSMQRKSGQGIRDFILQLLVQAARCDFGDLLEMQLEDRVIAGINDTTLQNELLKLSKPSFQEIRAHCEQYEDAQSATTTLPVVMFNSSKNNFVKGNQQRQQSKFPGSSHNAVPHYSKKKPVDIHPSNVKIRGITGHSIPVVGSGKLLIRDEGNTADSVFTVMESGPPIIGLKSMQALNVNISSLLSQDNSHQLKDLILQCSKATGGMHIKPVVLEVSVEPIFLKRRMIPYGLRESAAKALDELCAKGIVEKVEASAWATPIVTPSKSNGKTPRIFIEYS